MYMGRSPARHDVAAGLTPPSASWAKKLCPEHCLGLDLSRPTRATTATHVDARTDHLQCSAGSPPRARRRSASHSVQQQSQQSNRQSEQQSEQQAPAEKMPIKRVETGSQIPLSAVLKEEVDR